jgi:transposase
MDERMRFVIRLKDGETMAALCREFGISRKTGYKIFERYEQCGLEGLSDRARRPFRYANQLPEQVEPAIVSAKREKPHWGARKIRERLLRRLPHAIKTPAASNFLHKGPGHSRLPPPLQHAAIILSYRTPRLSSVPSVMKRGVCPSLRDQM